MSQPCPAGYNCGLVMKFPKESGIYQGTALIAQDNTGTMKWGEVGLVERFGDVHMST